MTTRQIRAARRDKLARREAQPEPVFEVDGTPTPLTEFIEVNADDADVVDWSRTAKVGAWYPSIVDCRRTA